MNQATKIEPETKKSFRKTVRIVIDDYLQNVIDSRRADNAMLGDADVVKILLGEKVTEEMKKQRKQAGRELLDLIKKVKAPKSFLGMTPEEQEEFIEAKFN